MFPATEAASTQHSSSSLWVMHGISCLLTNDGKLNYSYAASPWFSSSTEHVHCGSNLASDTLQPSSMDHNTSTAAQSSS
jgi:hypothetical protein